MTAPPGRMGLGCMRLSTDPEVDDGRAVAVIHAALDAGVRLLDTADAYAPEPGAVGHNERLIARALRTWQGDGDAVRVLTKGGLTRPGGRWVPDGRAGHLESACEASLRALGVSRLDTYLLHAPDPRRSFATSVRALARLQQRGLVETVGLCNVSVARIREARSIVDVRVVQVAAGPLHDEAFRNGVAELCADEDILLVAHSPFGGPGAAHRVGRVPALRSVAEAHGVTPWEAALAWMVDLHPGVVPIPGARRVETARSLATAMGVRLDDADRATLDRALPAAARLRGRPAGARDASAPVPRQAADEPAGEVLLVMGPPAGGKSTEARRWVERGYVRLNRDERGGRLRDLVPELERLAESGVRRFVLDNTYASRAERDRVLSAARDRGLAVRCLQVDTPLPEAQINAVLRMIRRYGEVLSPEAMKERGKDDPGVFDPRAQFRYRRAVEPPEPGEGFASVETVPFERTWPDRADRRAVIVEHDGVLRRSRSGARAPVSPDDVELLPGASEAIGRLLDASVRILGIAWHPEVGQGEADADSVAAITARTHRLLGVDVPFAYCPHPGGPPLCWCRKPLPGLVLPFLEEHALHPDRCTLVGPSTADRTLAERLGMAYATPEAFVGGDVAG